MYKLAAIQMHSKPKERETNIQTCIKMVEEAVNKGAQLVVLPELWLSGYYLSREEFELFGEEPTGKTVSLFRELAKKWGIVMIVPYVEKEQDDLYISQAIIESNGDLLVNYRKSFLWGREQGIFTPGERKYEVVNTSLGKIGVLICYDIEFPEPSRILTLQGAELIVAPSVWSIPAEPRWDIQLPARALDNTVYVLGVNTVYEGSCGKTKLVAPDGHVLCEAPRDEPYILLHDIDSSLIDETRVRIPYLEEFDMKLVPGS
ncbi:nitrilase-related carbon-nitrogen hydrolase [Bacillus sp. DTU_2020_1000418_1_SI_GHA_SEK_038]|uniref:nitrilase-related carbon-nitrogen hydrolase n=1 Tax=Bacillus sp. DTU_2020_1000418_1_SI_GHA_SEK_038 TaxID=3077585 RepID=UPI0028EFACEE|nr:nitrilase-related carbon-nitrogen hydrolase [Bacillus sp. DTU_2020_1000418_1_SI_GHA_SEK_038]WNS73711.1 nitrilase-related carbon-nitrogen hydrolase [Bacillus sp. DTU_2020_1000418_1_SI_GHA_SEK_038]